MIVQIDSEKLQKEIDRTKEINRRCDNEAWNAGLEQAEKIFRESVNKGSTESYVYCGELKNPLSNETDLCDTMNLWSAFPKKLQRFAGLFDWFPIDHLIRIEKADFGYNRNLLIYSEKLSNRDAVKYRLTYLGKRTSVSI